MLNYLDKRLIDAPWGLNPGSVSGKRALSPLRQAWAQFDVISTMRINFGVPSDRMILQRTKNLLQFTSTNQMAGECFIQVIELPVCFLEVKFFLRRNGRQASLIRRCVSPYGWWSMILYIFQLIILIYKDPCNAFGVFTSCKSRG